MSTGGHSIRELHSPADYQACLTLQRATWGEHFSELVPMSTVKLAQRLGGIAAGAFSPAGELLGFVFGMTGTENGLPIHWSDMLAVRADARDQGIGEALKRYQRETLLGRNVHIMRWTFDPLESRNAHINFARLGVVAREYVRDLYGPSDSPLHAGIGTDRLVVTWPLDSQRVAARLAGQSSPNPPDAWRAAPLINPVTTASNRPVSSAAQLDLDGAALRLAIPLDIQMLKAADPQLALAWRQHTRAAFEHYLAREYLVTEYIKAREYGCYVMERRPLLA